MADTRKGERVILQGLGAWYSSRELKILREMVEAPREAEGVWRDIMLIHGLKAELGGTIVDEREEALIRRAWDASEQESGAAPGSRPAPVKVAEMQPDYGSSKAARAPQSPVTVTS